jgi:hypothetical protein
MNKKVRTILGGMSTAGLIVAGSLPLVAQINDPPPSCTRAKSKSSQTEKTKAKAPSEKKVEQKKVESQAPAKTAGAKAKQSK